MRFLERQGGHVLMLFLLTLLSMGIWVYTGDKWLVQMFGAALLVAIQPGSGGGKKLDNDVPIIAKGLEPLPFPSSKAS